MGNPKSVFKGKVYNKKEKKMEFIALFIPALITVSVRYRRNKGEMWKWFDYVKEYLPFIFINFDRY